MEERVVTNVLDVTRENVRKYKAVGHRKFAKEIRRDENDQKKNMKRGKCKNKIKIKLHLIIISQYFNQFYRHFSF